MIPELIIALSLVLSLGEGGFKQRERATHELKKREIPYLYLKKIYHRVEDPEIKYRLIEVSYHQWCIETSRKYTDHYDNIDEYLQELHFKDDFKKED